MSLFLWIVKSTGSFDKLTQGGYDLESACGFVDECEKVKDCINRVCVPISDVYGGEIYKNCQNYCNYNYNMESIGELLCDDPQKAYDLYNYKCKGFEPSISDGFKFFGFYISYINLASFILFCFIIYFIYKRLK